MFVHGGRNNFVLSDLHMADWVVSWCCSTCLEFCVVR